ncbi:hypothetical protein JHK86_050308 [Glycine max]|nr:hypothetical protein JHK86_050308 [Glycine max]
MLELVNWDPLLAVSALEKEFVVDEDSAKRKFRFLMKYGKDLDLDDSWKLNLLNALPLVSPELNNPHYNNENSESSPDSKLFLPFVNKIRSVELEESSRDDLEYVDPSDQQAKTITFRFEKNMKDVGVGSMLEAPECPVEWPLQFKYIEVVKEEGLEISQPALDPDSIEIHHRITVKARTKKVHCRLRFRDCNHIVEIVFATYPLRYMIPICCESEMMGSNTN